MKVLKKAKRSKWRKELVCTGFGNGSKGCKSLLEVKHKDLVYYQGVEAETWGHRDPAVSFKCPVCNCCTDIGRDNWPQDYKNLTKVDAAWYKTTEDVSIKTINSGK